MKIIETKLSFGPLNKRASTKRIIIHNADARTCSADDIHSWHKENGWSGAGYHFLVRKDGKVYRLRPENTVGAHASGANSDSIGICFEGAFMKEKMGDTQLKAGAELVAYLMKKYGISKVLRHKDVGNTDCPGKNFPFDKLVKLAKEQKPAESKPATSAKPATSTTFKPYKVKVTASTLNVRAGAGTVYRVVTTVKKGGVYTIVDSKNGFGKLKSGAGWISLSYTKKC